jgi:hypothetical protein
MGRGTRNSQKLRARPPAGSPHHAPALPRDTPPKNRENREPRSQLGSWSNAVPRNLQFAMTGCPLAGPSVRRWRRSTCCPSCRRSARASFQLPVWIDVIQDVGGRSVVFFLLCRPSCVTTPKQDHGPAPLVLGIPESTPNHNLIARRRSSRFQVSRLPLPPPPRGAGAAEGSFPACITGIPPNVSR